MLKSNKMRVLKYIVGFTVALLLIGLLIWQRITRRTSPLKISLTACPRKNSEMHFCIFLCCGQKNKNIKSEVNL